MTKKLKPRKFPKAPWSAVEEGYALMRGHQALQGTPIVGKNGATVVPPHESDYYILMAARCMPEAFDDVNLSLKEAGRDQIFHHETGPAEDLIGEAYEATVNKAASYATRYRAGGKMKSAHKYVSDLMERLGFDEITDRDFAEFGVGGGR